MALSALWQAAQQRLATFYNGGVRIPEGQPSANPGGFDGDGHTLNFVPALRDVALVGQGIAEAVAGIDEDVASATASAADAADSEAVALFQASRAKTEADRAAAAAGSVDGASIAARFDAVEGRATVLENTGYQLALLEHFGA